MSIETTDLGVSPVRDADAMEEVVEHHRVLYDALVREHGGPVWDEPWAIDSLRRLLEEQGYSLSDVGDMLGVTRERVRQICLRHGIDHAKIKSGSALRIWNGERFKPMPTDEYLGRYRKRARERRERRIVERQKRVRVEHIRTLRALRDDIGGPVPIGTFLERVGMSEPAVARYWGYGPQPCEQHLPSYSAAMDLIYKVAGVERAPATTRGEPRTNGKTGRPYFDAVNDRRVRAGLTWRDLDETVGFHVISALRYYGPDLPDDKREAIERALKNRGRE